MDSVGLEANFNRTKPTMYAKEKVMPSDPLVCSFCGKGQDRIKVLVAGPDVYICDECVVMASEIIKETLNTKEEEK